RLEVDVPASSGQAEVGPVAVLAGRDVRTALTRLGPAQRDLRVGDRLSAGALHGAFDARLASPFLRGKRGGGEGENESEGCETLDHVSPPTDGFQRTSKYISSVGRAPIHARQTSPKRGEPARGGPGLPGSRTSGEEP